MCPPLRAAPPCIFAVLQKCQRALPCARPCGRLRRAFLLSCKNVSGHFHVPAPAGGSAVHFCCPAKMSAGTSLCPPLRAAPPCIFAVLQKCQRALPCARPCGRLRRAFLLSCKNVSGHFHVPAPAGGSAVHFCCPAKMSAGTSMCPPLRAAPPCIFAVLQKCQRALPCARPCGRLRRAFLLSCKNVSGHFHVPAPAGGSAVHFCCPAKMSAGTSLCPPLRAAPPCIFAVLQKCADLLADSMPYGTESGGTSMCRTGNSVIQSFPTPRARPPWRG